MSLTSQLPLVFDVLPDGGDRWPALLFLLKVEGESRKDTAMIALSIQGNGLRNLWWYERQRDRPTISIYEMLRSIRARDVYICDVPMPSEALLPHLIVHFGTEKARLLYYPRTEEAQSTITCRNKAVANQVHKGQTEQGQRGSERGLS